MSADVLREAAALMRERAEGVTQGAQWTGGNYWITDHDPSDPTGQTAMQRLIGGMDGPDADHYANLHPAVALAVADWLDGQAIKFAENAALWQRTSQNPQNGWAERGLTVEANLEHHYRDALAVARAYLGGTP